MPLPIHGLDDPNVHEAEPFLSPTNFDTDVELQDRRTYQEQRQYDDTDESTYALPASNHINDYQHDVLNSKYLGSKRLWDFLQPLHSWSKSPRIVKRSRRVRVGGWGRPFAVVWRMLLALLIILGFFQLITLVLGFFSAFFPEQLDHAYRTWRSQDPVDGQNRWPTDATAGIVPVACHSHNDYWRRIPFESAIQAGCVGVEADVWLQGDELLVGHSKSSLTRERTFSALYIEPLVALLDKQNPLTEFQDAALSPPNGVFDTDPSQTLVLLVDFKTEGHETGQFVSVALEPLREKHYLTYFNGTAIIPGPVIVVATGVAPFNQLMANMMYRSIFYDAPLERLASLAGSQASSKYDPSIEKAYLASIKNNPDSTSGDAYKGQGYSGHIPSDPAIFTPANSYYASVDFRASIGWPQPYLSTSQREMIVAQVSGAHAQGLKVRYWNVPNWPIGLRNYLWRELVKMGVDYLNVDDLYGATRGDWRSATSIWSWSLWGGADW